MNHGISDAALHSENQRLNGPSAEEIVYWAQGAFGSRLSVATSMQDAVLIDIVVRLVPDVDVVFIDTGYHFDETYDTLFRVEQHYGIQVRRAKLEAPLDYLWQRDALSCCQQRKVRPFREALRGQQAWMSGLRRADSALRMAALPVERDQEGLVKINPIVDWSDEEVAEYVSRNEVPVNPLVNHGFKSVGCWPCTAPVGEDSPRRAGRWPGSDKTECGLHQYEYEPGSKEREEAPMRVIVLGGDGFCGWPTALHLSQQGHDVAIVDNLSRRNIDNELEAESLTPIQPLGTRLSVWRDLSGRSISSFRFDIAQNYEALLGLLRDFRPDAVVHFAEQRAAPYSMKSSWHKRYTVSNNLNGTNNLLAAVVESGLDVHIVHLGTMGVYGYGTAGMAIPEGYLHVKVPADNGELVDEEILYPTNPGSVYHMTKSQDQLLFAYYNKNDGVRVTDLHQGVVWGTQTDETAKDEMLINRFDYDGDFGTVLNRFLMQAAVGYPLTVHGSGGQTRAFIHIRDTVRCIELAVQDGPVAGERVRILNQMTETHRVRDLAKLVAGLTDASVEYIENPRNEADENDLRVRNEGFLRRGLSPLSLADGLMQEVTQIAQKYSHRADMSKIPCSSYW